MATYAIARIESIVMGAAIRAYLERIDATLAPFEGRFLVHGGPFDRLEGSWTGDLVIIGFPDRARARAWYDSPAYRAILPLRTANSSADVILIDTVGHDHRATDILPVAGRRAAGVQSGS
jgi:uncharacterized protein (DUF1330 family)